jgi:hypothetical protein
VYACDQRTAYLITGLAAEAHDAAQDAFLAGTTTPEAVLRAAGG